MAYGNSQRLGETINPALMQADYSGFANAGMIQGQALAGVGQDIGNAIKQNKLNEREIKKSEQMAKSIRDAIPELAPMAVNALKELNNADLTTNQKLAIAAGIQDSLKIGILGLDRKRDASLMDFEREKFSKQMNLSERELAARMMEIEGDSPIIMSGDELNQQIASGAQIDFVPLGNNQYQVKKARANAVPAFGSIPFIDQNGQIQQTAPQSQGGIRVPTGDQSATGIIDGVNMGNVAPLPLDGALLPPRQDQAQLIQQAIPSSPVPKGDVWRMDEDGLVAGQIPGSMLDLEAQAKRAQIKESESKTAQAQAEAGRAETAKEKSARQEFSKTNFIIDKANEAEAIIKNDIANYGAGAIVDMGKSMIPGTAAYKLQKQILPALKDSIALDNLRKLKESSPTGSSGMGSLTEKEGKRLENAFGVLDVGGDKETLLKDIARLKEETFNTVHGTKAEREKALKEGKITADQNNQVEQMYNEQILGMKAQPQSQDKVGIDPEVEQMLKDLGL